MVLPQRCGLNTVSFGQYGGVCDYITQFFSTTVSEMYCMRVQYVSKMQDVFFFFFYATEEVFSLWNFAGLFVTSSCLWRERSEILYVVLVQGLAQ